jgi:hypothetical protein
MQCNAKCDCETATSSHIHTVSHMYETSYSMSSISDHRAYVSYSYVCTYVSEFLLEEKKKEEERHNDIISCTYFFRFKGFLRQEDVLI